MSQSEEEVGELAPAQEGLYFLQLLVPDSSAYNSCCATRLRGLDVLRFRQAGERLVQRHPQLRARFEATPEGPRQRVRAVGRFDFTLEDARGSSASELQDRLQRQVHRPFDLALGDLLRVTAFQVGPGEHVVLFSIHHAISDLWSAGLMLEELGLLYGELTHGAPASLAEPAIHYLTYARRMRERLAGGEGEALWAFWREELEGALVPLRLPAERPRPELPGLKGGTVRARISPALTASVRALSVREGAPLLAVLMATLDLQLWTYSGARDVLVSTPVHGRTRRALRGVFGQFVNSTVVRARPGPEMTFSALVEQVRAALFRSLRHCEYPLHALVQRLGPAARVPLAQVQLALQDLEQDRDPASQAFWAGEPEGRIRAGALEYGCVPLDSEEGQFDLHLLLYSVGDELSCHLKYDADLFDPGTARRMLDDYLGLLEQACAHPKTPLGTLGRAVTAHVQVTGLSDDEVERQLRALLGGG
ncbi:MAG: condensation domain-containing protein [Myxococcota bacterium]|nr:condensation domain-containing protein [Myxococcota bacterium]